MTAPRLEIDLAKIEHNARTLVSQLALLGISVTGVTKACLGSPEIARVLIRAGVKGLGDSRIENLETMKRAGILGPLTLIRGPMPSQVDRVVAAADISLNTEFDVIALLDGAARRAGTTHGIVLMVELGDLREGIMPNDLEAVVRDVLCLPNIRFMGIGTNLACRNGVMPDARNMTELSVLVNVIEASVGVPVQIVSGGNSATLPWLLNGGDAGRIDNLRLGEAILLGREPLRCRPIEGLYTDAFSLVAEVIETKVKPVQPWGVLAPSGRTLPPASNHGERITQSILALGDQDTETSGLSAPSGIAILAATSDHLVVESTARKTSIGAEVRFQPSYEALVRAMTSPFVAQVVKGAATWVKPVRFPQIEPPHGRLTPVIARPGSRPAISLSGRTESQTSTIP